MTLLFAGRVRFAASRGYRRCPCLGRRSLSPIAARSGRAWSRRSDDAGGLPEFLERWTRRFDVRIGIGIAAHQDCELHQPPQNSHGVENAEGALVDDIRKRSLTVAQSNDRRYLGGYGVARMLKAILAGRVDRGRRSDVLHRVGEIALEPIKLLQEFLGGLVQLTAPHDWAKVQFQLAIIPKEDVLYRRHALKMDDLGRGQLAFVEEELAVPAFAFKLKQAGTRQPAQGSGHRKGVCRRDREREGRLLARLLRGGRTRLDQQLARGQNVAHEGWQRQQVHIAAIFERLAQFLGAEDQQGQSSERFLAADLANERVRLVVVHPRHDDHDLSA